MAELNSEIKTENIQDLEKFFESGDAMKPNLREKRHVFEFEHQIGETNNYERSILDDSSLLKFDDELLRDGGREKKRPSQVSTLAETVAPPKQQKLECGYGQFRLEDRVESCRSWLSCKEIKNEVEFDRSKLLGKGLTKLAYLGTWRNRSVVVSIRNKQHRERFADFQNNIETLKKLQTPTTTVISESKVVKLLGACDNKFLVTEYYQRGTLRDLLKSTEYSGYSLTARLKLVLEYVKAIEFLHTASDHPRVYCDSNKLDGTTKQYLLTDDGRLVIGDLDDVPEVVAGEKIVCKHADFLYNRTDILKEGFLAPEQQIITSPTETVTKTDTTENKNTSSSSSPTSHSPEKVSKLSTSFPKFDHRADIFKIADVAVHIITGGTYAKPDSVASGTNVQGVPSWEFLVRAKKLLYSENGELARILALCRNRNPDRRPEVGLVKTVLNRVVVLRLKRGLV